MLSKLRRLLFGAPAPPMRTVVQTNAAADRRPGAPRLPETGGIPISPAQIDTAFYGLILGANSAVDRAPNGFETRVLRELEQLLAADIVHSNLVPRLPSVIPRVMTSLRNQDSSAADLAHELGRDAVLVSEVIRLANSPYYGVCTEITSLERAVVTLGRTGVRQLVARAAFKPLLNVNTGHFSKLAGTLLWEQSEQAAIACDIMAKQEHIDRFHAYLAAIVQNVGFTVSLQILDRQFDGSEAPNSLRFRDQWVRLSRSLASLIAGQWDFPTPVLGALKTQVDGMDLTRLPIIDAVLAAADKLSKLRLLALRGRIDADPPPALDLPHPRLSAYYADCYRQLQLEQVQRSSVEMAR